jgi:hypothetical protein
MEASMFLLTIEQTAFSGVTRTNTPEIRGYIMNNASRYLELSRVVAGSKE